MDKCLESVYRNHRQGLYSLAVSIVGSRQQAEDAVHEAFVKLVDRDIPECDLTAYVFRTVRNCAIDATRRRGRQNRLANMIFNGFHQSEITEQPAAVLLTRERNQLLRDAVFDLPEPQREAVILRTFSGLTFGQAAEVLDIPAKTVATRYRRALKTLEVRLRGQL